MSDDTITGRLTIGGKTYTITGKLEGAAQSAQAPRIATNPSTNEVKVSFTRYSVKTGEGAKGPWEKFSAYGDDGNWYATFSETDGAVLKEVNNTGHKVLVTFKQTEYGRNIISIDDEVPGVRPAPRAGADPTARGPDLAPSAADDNLPF